MEATQTESASIAALAAALAKAQGEMTAAKKDSTNPHFKSKYADLASVWEACRASLAKNGLSVVQRISMRADGVAVRTRLMHASGEWLEDELVVPIAQRTAQSIGSSVTYARRYALAAMVGVAADDDDGNAATDAAPKDSGTKEAPRQQAAKTSRTEEAKAKLAAATKPEDAPGSWKRIVEFGALHGMTEAEVKTHAEPFLQGKKKVLLADEADITGSIARTHKRIVGDPNGIHMAPEQPEVPF